MADNRTTHDREPAEGARDKVNVPHASDEAAADPNRPDAGDDRPSSAAGTRPNRADDAEQAHTPPGDESRETRNDDAGDRHNPRRTSM